jgi:hypothetical protein
MDNNMHALIDPLLFGVEGTITMLNQALSSTPSQSHRVYPFGGAAPCVNTK